jgi:hypothetical protein
MSQSTQTNSDENHSQVPVPTLEQRLIQCDVKVCRQQQGGSMHSVVYQKPQKKTEYVN